MLTGSLRAKTTGFSCSEVFIHGRRTTLTKCPGPLSYMPPEVIADNPHYDTKLDMFCFGVLMVHTLCAHWPMPEKAFRYEDPSKSSVLVPVPESERRAKHLDQIGRDHSLMDLILRCLSNDPHRRPTAVDVLTEISQRAEAAGYSLRQQEVLSLVSQTVYWVAQCSSIVYGCS